MIFFIRQASPAALAALSSAVESAVSEGIRVSTPTVDVFIVENLFLQAISASQERLATAAKNEKGMVAWGNTNIQVGGVVKAYCTLPCKSKQTMVYYTRCQSCGHFFLIFLCSFLVALKFFWHFVSLEQAGHC